MQIQGGTRSARHSKPLPHLDPRTVRAPDSPFRPLNRSVALLQGILVRPPTASRRPGWLLKSRILKRPRIGRLSLLFFERLVWLWRRIDPLLPWGPTSLIAIARKEVKGLWKDMPIFVNDVAALAEEEGHHPDIAVRDWNCVDLSLWTHAIGGLSENDFILAAKIDLLPRDAPPSG